MPCRDLPPATEGSNMAELEKTQTLGMYAEKLLTSSSLPFSARPSSLFHETLSSPTGAGSADARILRNRRIHSLWGGQGWAGGPDAGSFCGVREGLEETPALCFPMESLLDCSTPVLLSSPARQSDSSTKNCLPAFPRTLPQSPICPSLSVLGRWWFG